MHCLRHIFAFLPLEEEACCQIDARRGRQIYTRQQTLELEKEFQTNRYLTRPRRIEISHDLRLTERQVIFTKGL
ncbi:unnamed protein product [Protopolystoma xenopodis]|uniref:Homeobox domain-containing protein n=1 Tax=Protopolystoma xenopodis TaxID=117903 RepID=A0A448WYS9_9PLAT|nr:unnamed protein product [Protopolystoma xenopodis]